jgi:hypothetical protein
LTNGTLTAPSGEFNVSGNWIKTGGTFNPGSNTVKFTAATSQTLNTGGADFNNIDHTGSGTLQLVANGLTVTNKLSNLAGLLDANGSQITINGDWINNGTFTSGAGTVLFTGIADQVIGGTATTSFGSAGTGGVTINKNAGEILLSADIMVDGTLALTNGIINGVTAGKVVTIGSLGSVGGGSSSSHVSGKLAHIFSGAASKIYPVGKGGNWRRVLIDLTSVTGPPSTIAVEQIEALFTGALPPYTTIPNARYWSITSSGGSGHVFDLTVDGTDFIPGISAQPVILKDNGTTTYYNASFSSPDYTAPGIDGFSNFALASQCNPPTIDAQPASPAAICEGTGSRQFTVAASGQGSYAFTYQWQESASGTGGTFTDISNDALYSGTTTNTLTITAPLAIMNGYAYRVIINRPCGTSTTSDGTSVLTVYTTPVISADPANQVKCPNESVSFTAAANGFPTPGVQWQVSTDNGGTFNDLAGQTNTTLNFNVSTGMDNNQYRAVFTNVCGTATTAPASLTITRYTILVTQSSNGIVTPGSTAILCGADQSFTITADDCYHITDVLVDGVSIGAVATYDFTDVQSDRTIAASFARNVYAITATAGINGSITPSGATNVNCGDNQSFTITPNACYHIADVLVDGVSVGAVSSYDFTDVQAAHTISASFAQNVYTITATAGANGSISPSGVANVNCGDDQSFTITPNACYHIADVLVDGVSVGAVSSYDFSNVQAAHTISASFVQNVYTITATAGANGLINPSGVTNVNCGDDQSFTITTERMLPYC